jgi:hypothetical protein
MSSAFFQMSVYSANLFPLSLDKPYHFFLNTLIKKFQEMIPKNGKKSKKSSFFVIPITSKRDVLPLYLNTVLRNSIFIESGCLR